MNLTRATDRTALWIDDDWLEEKKHDKSAYVDIRELMRGQGEYYSWLKNKHGKKYADLRVNEAMTTFTGIRINDSSDYWVKCMMSSDTVAQRRYFAPGVTHPNCIRRVYAHRTSARGIEIVGVSGAVA